MQDMYTNTLYTRNSLQFWVKYGQPKCWVKKMKLINLTQQLGSSIFDPKLGKNNQAFF